MDKSNFLHKLKGLPTFQCAGQALYPACTEGAQILLGVQSGRFCTIPPVDMHGFVHTPFGHASGAWANVGLGEQENVSAERKAASEVLVQARSEAWDQQSDGRQQKKILRTRSLRSSGLQAKEVYKNSSSVNNDPFLWISRLTDMKSSAYTRYKPVMPAVPPA